MPAPRIDPLSWKSLAVALGALTACLLLAGNTRATQLVRLDAELSRGFTAAFLAREKQLVVTDWNVRALKVFDLKGRLVRQAESSKSLPLDRPDRIVPDGDGFLVLDSDAHLLWLDRNLAQRAHWRLPSRSGAKPNQPLLADRGPITEAFFWEAVPHGHRIVVSGDVQDASGWRTGIGEIAKREPLSYRLLVEKPTKNPWYLYDVNLQPSLASTGTALYALDFNGKAQLHRIEPRPARFNLPPPLDAPLAQLGPLGGRNNALRLFARLRSQPLPASLVAWQGNLYLLGWVPGAAGTLEWRLWRFDGQGHWRGPSTLALLPQAREVLCIPGSESWAFVLKGDLVEPEQQKILGLQLIAADTVLRGLL